MRRGGVCWRLIPDVERNRGSPSADSHRQQRHSHSQMARRIWIPVGLETDLSPMPRPPYSHSATSGHWKHVSVRVTSRHTLLRLPRDLLELDDSPRMKVLQVLIRGSGLQQPKSVPDQAVTMIISTQILKRFHSKKLKKKTENKKRCSTCLTTG